MNIFGTKSLDSILATFTRTQAELEMFTEQQTNEATLLRTEAQAKVAEAEAREQDIQKALRVRNKITDILGD